MVLGQEKRKRQIRFYALAALALLLVAGYVIVIVLTRRHYAEIKEVQQELLVQIDLERRVRDTAGVLAELSGERASAQQYFKNPDDVIGIIEELEGFGSVIGVPVSVAQVEVEGENTETREGVFVANVQSDGSWKKMSHLLALLDSLPYQSTVSQLSLDTGGIDIDTPTPIWALRATLRITLRK
jgi:hypothetical protein